MDRTVTSNASHIGSADRRRGFMGSSNRFATKLSASQGHLASHSNILNNLSVVSEDEQVYIAVLWGTNFDVKEVEGKIKNFIKNYQPATAVIEEDNPLNYYMAKLKNIKETELYYLNVDCHHIFEMDKLLYYQLIYYPPETILYFDRIINDIYKETFLEENEKANFENQILARFNNLRQKSRMRDLNPKDINH